MSISLDLPSYLETELATEASNLNLPLSEYILQILSSRSSAQNPPKTGADLLKYWESVGVIGSRSDIENSQQYARDLRNEAETRKQV
ncbi:MAG: hypothetical protein AAFP20_24380 [Cyanobacteria bacterium J06614_10]